MTTPSPMYLASQACQPESVPEGGPQVSEALRLGSSLAWAYEFIVYQYEQPYAFSGAVYYNENPVDSARYDAESQFELIEETDGSEAKLVVRAINERCSMESVEVVPLDSAQQPIDFAIVDLSAAQRTLRYAKDSSSNFLKIRMTGLNVLQTNAAQACVQSGTPVCFSAPLFALVDRRAAAANEIHIEELGGAPAGARGLKDHMNTFFNTLLAGVSNCTLSMRCDYSYPLEATGPWASIPILALAPEVYAADSADLSASQLTSYLKQFFTQQAPPSHGTIMFQITGYHSRLSNGTPSLLLEALSLATDSVADISSPA